MRWPDPEPSDTSFPGEDWIIPAACTHARWEVRGTFTHSSVCFILFRSLFLSHLLSHMTLLSQHAEVTEQAQACWQARAPYLSYILVYSLNIAGLIVLQIPLLLCVCVCVLL